MTYTLLILTLLSTVTGIIVARYHEMEGIMLSLFSAVGVFACIFYLIANYLSGG